MPALTSLFRVSVTDLPAIAAAGPLGALAALRRVGEECDEEYFWSGDRLLLIVQFLWHHDKISLFSLAHERLERDLCAEETSAVLIMGTEHKRLLPKLQARRDESSRESQALISGLVAWGVPRAEARLAARDALTLLCEQIADLPDGTVLIIHVA